MEKRTSERIHVDIEMKFICCNKVYSGKMTNVSKSGMFVQVDEICYPFNSHLEMVIPFNGNELHVPVDLNRIVMSPDSTFLSFLLVLIPSTAHSGQKRTYAVV